MQTSPSETTDTFIDAYGRCYIAGQKVDQPVYERHMRDRFEADRVIARLWRHVTQTAGADPALFLDCSDRISIALDQVVCTIVDPIDEGGTQ